MSNDDKILKLAHAVLDHHFGVRNPKGETVCARCGNLDVPFPCDPARLAQESQALVLSR